MGDAVTRSGNVSILANVKAEGIAYTGQSLCRAWKSGKF